MPLVEGRLRSNNNEQLFYTFKIFKPGVSSSNAVQCHAENTAFWEHFTFLREMQSSFSKSRRQGVFIQR